MIVGKGNISWIFGKHMKEENERMEKEQHR